jgi:hypothetical protein
MTDEPTKRPRGKQTLFTQEVANEICARLATGISLREACNHPHLPSAPTVISWALTDYHGFSDQYTQAREAQHYALADKLLDLINETPEYTTNKITGERRIDPGYESMRKNKIEGLKWIISRILPKTYGDKVVVDVTQKINVDDMTDAQLVQYIGNQVARLPRGNGVTGGVTHVIEHDTIEQ